MEKNILIIQTAFIGDSVLATSLIEATSKKFPEVKIHFLIRKGNESIALNNPLIHKLWIWDKSGFKYLKLLKLAFKMREFIFEGVLNIHRHASSGLVSALMKSKHKIGFDKNPLSFLFTKKIEHNIPHMKNDKALHEVQRNFLLLNELGQSTDIPDDKSLKPKLYFAKSEQEKVSVYRKDLSTKEYVIVVPASVWFTKQWTQQKWKELTGLLAEHYTVYMIGAPSEKEFCREIIGDNKNCQNLCGELSLSESACLMNGAKRVFVNDSAALHLASSVNAPTTAVFNSTVAEFGYYPLSDNSIVIESKRPDCKPCGLHGHKSCPKDHFICATDINVMDVFNSI
jgi:ADP-heptose:LPS heptosyltransferase